MNTCRGRLKADLAIATQNRDLATMRALRTLLGTFDNAEAVDPDGAQPVNPGGNMPNEVIRKALGEEDVRQIMQEEAEARRTTLVGYERLGRGAAANQIRIELAILDKYLADDG